MDEPIVMRVEKSGDDTETFNASRWTDGNFWFPVRVEVSPLQITCIRRGVVRKDAESIMLTQVASVRIHSGLLFAELIVESSGGVEPIAVHGLYKRDAERIKELLDHHLRQRTKRNDGL